MEIRLDEYDTPEHAGRCARESQAARRATEFVNAWFARAELAVSVAIPAGSDLDSFGRGIGRVTYKGESLGAALFAAGLARPFKRGRNEGWCDD